MSQPNERDYQIAERCLEAFVRTGKISDDIAAAIANARTEGAEAMRESMEHFVVGFLAGVKIRDEWTQEDYYRNRGAESAVEDILDKIRIFPTPEGDATTTEDTGEETTP